MSKRLDWHACVGAGSREQEATALRQHERTERSLGSGAFMKGLEAMTGRALALRKRQPAESQIWRPRN